MSKSHKNSSSIVLKVQIALILNLSYSCRRFFLLIWSLESLKMAVIL